MKRQRTPQMRWTPGLQQLSDVSVRQPYAWLVVNGYKDVENRSRRTHYRGPLLIHAGLNRNQLSKEALRQCELRYGVKLPPPDAYERGGIVGIVDIVDCKHRSSSRWHERGKMGWILEKPRRLRFRPCKGALNFFKPKFAED